VSTQDFRKGGTRGETPAPVRRIPQAARRRRSISLEIFMVSLRHGDCPGGGRGSDHDVAARRAMLRAARRRGAGAFHASRHGRHVGGAQRRHDIGRSGISRRRNVARTGAGERLWCSSSTLRPSGAAPRRRPRSRRPPGSERWVRVGRVFWAPAAIGRRERADRSVVRSAVEPSDLPNVVLFERRHQPDRRDVWRGGRRATDWTNRPVGAWPQLEKRSVSWRVWLGKLSLRGEPARHL